MPLAVSEVAGGLAHLAAEELAAVWPELWVQAEEIDAARLQARVDRVNLSQRMLGLNLSHGGAPRTYAGHKRPQPHSARELTVRLPRPSPFASEGASSPTSPPAGGLCLARGMPPAGGCGGCSYASAPQSPRTTYSVMGLPAAPPAPANGGLCLQRAATSIGRPYGHDQIARMRARSATLAAAGVAAQPQKRVARNPHGLSMSQRVAALQIGRPATYVHSTM